MNTGGVLLVDDVPGERANFEHAFGRDLTVAPSIDQLNEQLRRGLTWDLAFVDFNLSSQTSTGLTALLRLHHERPTTEIVTYSQFTESGRTLYAAAAHHWFNASALMDKTKNDPGTLVHYRESICSGINPTPVPWQRRLQLGSAYRQPAGRRILGENLAGTPRRRRRHGACRRDVARRFQQLARLQGPRNRGRH
jgi:hypothetical protein